MGWLSETSIAFSLTLGFILVVQACVLTIRMLYEPQDDEPQDWDAPVLAGPTAPLPPHRTFTEVTIGPDGKYVGTATPEHQFRLYPGEEVALTIPRIYEPPEEGSSDADSR